MLTCISPREVSFLIHFKLVLLHQGFIKCSSELFDGSFVYLFLIIIFFNKLKFVGTWKGFYLFISISFWGIRTFSIIICFLINCFFIAFWIILGNKKFIVFLILDSIEIMFFKLVWFNAGLTTLTKF